MSETCLLDVTDLKQYVCCPRLIYYRYTLPAIRPLTYTMEIGIQSHQQEEEREVRRSLKNYGIEHGERLFRYPVSSDTIGIKGNVDLVLIVPTSNGESQEAIVVEYKHSEQKVGPHFKLQLAAYALLIEEQLGIPVLHSFIYSIPLRKTEKITLTPALRNKVGTVVREIRSIMDSEQMPPPTRSARRCPTCEFRRFCNDIV
ncbi:CRISPR-associated protein Cas4 [Dictyobacter formicarum]|uniref:CRISPR-associated exonuclease Cas4 n=1 Tax=Dictyobacter formicarum TaxID=2778368 RepID=A0ABQ3VRI0_9CHLR|nr:CRISPR-associated protein Cas4 [Dictyobacter formicarum]GHO88877.1 CRISPR-associated protein Cas4 [Dictyobacter formicarum]